MAPPTALDRAALARCKRLVVKIGSRSIIGGDRPGEVRFQVVADQIAALHRAGFEVVLVSSGAVALGVERLGLAQRPTDLPRLQGAAAVGQCALIHAYEVAFRAHGLPVAQMLLTHDGITDGVRSRNARAALDAVLGQGVVPIINENDTVATAEIEFGDNDQLAAMVANLVDADLLVLLTDVEGLLDGDRERIAVISDIDRVGDLVWTEPRKQVSLGGMASKLAAAKRVLRWGNPVVIGPAMMDDALLRIMRAEDVGTLFLPPHFEGGAERERWITEGLERRGRLWIEPRSIGELRGGDDGLLAAAIVGVEGDFEAGDAVSVAVRGGEELGCGLSRYNAGEVRRLALSASGDHGARAGAIPDGGVFRGGRDTVVQRDDLVMMV